MPWEGIEKSYETMFEMSRRMLIHCPGTKSIDVQKANLTYREQRKCSKSQTRKMTRRLVEQLGKILKEIWEMLDYLKSSIQDWTDASEIARHIERILAGKAGDGQGLVYGIGHAVYTLSDPRAVLLKKLAGELAAEKGRSSEYEFLQLVEKVAIETIYRVKGRDKTMCANVDFYSGFVYDLIGIPRDIYTPLFAMARIVGWCAHRNEELNFEGRRIIRPAYRCVTEERGYVAIGGR